MNQTIKHYQLNKYNEEIWTILIRCIFNKPIFFNYYYASLGSNANKLIYITSVQMFLNDILNNYVRYIIKTSNKLFT